MQQRHSDEHPRRLDESLLLGHHAGDSRADAELAASTVALSAEPTTSGDNDDEARTLRSHHPHYPHSSVADPGAFLPSGGSGTRIGLLPAHTLLPQASNFNSNTTLASSATPATATATAATATPSAATSAAASSAPFASHSPSFQQFRSQTPPLVTGALSASSSQLLPSMAFLHNAADIPSFERKRSASFSSTSSPGAPFRSMSRSPPVSGSTTPTRRTSTSGPIRIRQLQQEDNVSETLQREVAHERDTTSSILLTHGCDDLHIDPANVIRPIPSPTLSPKLIPTSGNGRNPIPVSLGSPHRHRSSSPSPLSSAPPTSHETAVALVKGGNMQPDGGKKRFEPYTVSPLMQRRAAANAAIAASQNELMEQAYDSTLFEAQYRLSAFLVPSSSSSTLASPMPTGSSLVSTDDSGGGSMFSQGSESDSTPTATATMVMDSVLLPAAGQLPHPSADPLDSM